MDPHVLREQDTNRLIVHTQMQDAEEICGAHLLRAYVHAYIYIYIHIYIYGPWGFSQFGIMARWWLAAVDAERSPNFCAKAAEIVMVALALSHKIVAFCILGNQRNEFCTFLLERSYDPQVPRRCLQVPPDASRWLQDASQMPLCRCLQGVCRMPRDASKMPRRYLQVSPRGCSGCGSNMRTHIHIYIYIYICVCVRCSCG